MLKKSLRAKIVFSIVLTVLTFACAFTLFWFQHVNRALEREFDLQVDTAIELSTDPLAKALWEFDFQNAASALSSLHELSAYQFAVVESAGQTFLRDSLEDAWRAEWDDLLTNLRVQSAAYGRQNIGEQMIVTERLVFEGVDVGQLILGFSKHDLNAESDFLLMSSVAYVTGLAILMVLILSLWLSKLIGPIGALARTVRGISVGELPEGAMADGRTDEIGDLAHAVDLLRSSFVEARTDKLTGLPNRRALDDRLAAVGDDDYALLLIDLNDFKPINDTFGHEAGDLVLCEIADRLRALGDATTSAFRLGGDEFALVVARLTDVERARRLAMKAAEDVRRAITHNEEQLHVSVSIGVAVASMTGGRASDVLSAADTAMYVAKRDAAASVVLYENSNTHRRYGARDRRELEDSLASGEISPWLQPQVCLRTGNVCGYEALARWRHPERGLLKPGAFMPMVEELQMQRSLDYAMTRSVLEMIQRCAQSGAAAPRVAVNIAEPTLARTEGVEQILTLLEEFTPFLDRLTLEITEDVFVARSAESIRRALKKLFDTGVRISMDDFGTGYGSFRHLQEWRFHELKIDRSFVKEIGKDSSSEVIIQSFISLSKGLGADIVAEGVETEEQLDFLRSNGCDYAQGFFLGLPEPISEITRQRDPTRAAS